MLRCNIQVIDTARRRKVLSSWQLVSALLSTTYANPDHAKAPRPTAIVMNITDKVGSMIYAVSIMKTVWARKAPQLKLRRTCVVVQIPFSCNQSAKYPEMASKMPMARYGTADMKPVLPRSKLSVSTAIEESNENTLQALAGNVDSPLRKLGN